MTDRPDNPSQADLHCYQEQRQHLLHEHEQLLARLRNRPPSETPTADTEDHPLMTRFKELQLLVDMQQRRIGDLLEIEKAYHDLHQQFTTIELTNQKLVQQLLLFSDFEEHKKELEALVKKQQKELENARIHLREARTRIDAQRTRQMQMEDENAHLSNRMEDYRIRLEALLEKEQRDEKQLKRLKDELRRSQEAYEQQQRKYRKMRAEYETIYRKK